MTSIPATTRRCALRLSCHSARGQVAAVVSWLERHLAYIEELAVFDDVPTRRFFLRAVFRQDGDGMGTVEEIRAGFEPVARAVEAIDWSIHDIARLPRVLLMVSKLSHCLDDLLASWKRGEMPMQPVAIVSNHRDLYATARAHEIPFYHLPVTPDTKVQQEQELLQLVERLNVDWIVLARYMQILSDETCGRLSGKVINIHHSFLPGFKGAKPYHQAFERGVKLIGATAHFATADLDEGPIIDQATERVDHEHGPDDLLNVGRRTECSVLSRALRSVLEHRVFVNGHRTVVLR